MGLRHLQADGLGNFVHDLRTGHPRHHHYAAPVYYFARILWLWKVWQGRGDTKPSPERATSTYGRPLVKQG